MTDTTQQNRLLSITTPLGEDHLLLSQFTAKEKLSGLFSVEVELLHEENETGYTATDVDVTSILGQMVTIWISHRDGVERTLNGLVNSFSKGHRTTRFSHYTATIVPHVWLLTQNFQSRIFQHMSVPAILEEVLMGFQVSYEIQGEFQPRNYCVQYRESDFDFVSRLMQEEGLYYYFEHVGDSHKMIIANSPQSHLELPSKSTIPYFVQTSHEEDFVSSIHNVWVDCKLQTGTVTLWDNNFQMPMNKLDAQQPSLFNVGDNQNLERYEFPGGYARKFDGIDGTGGEASGNLQNLFSDKSRTVENMMRALDADYKVFSGKSDCCSVTAGHRFAIEDHPTDDFNAQYVVTSVTHVAEQNPQYVSDDELDKPYKNKLTFIPHGSGAPTYCPPRTTPKPLIYGTQTATVVGPAGEEIFTDKYGRVKVQFHWDREGEVDANSSCWIRVSQGWAGNRWGMMFIPRVGMEVLVHFIDGDPDQPIITGCVYNPQTMPPYELPDEKSKMTIKSDSSKGGNGFNEIRFEDKKGSEQIFVHGEKDIDVRNKNDRREWIGNDHHFIVKRDRHENIERDGHYLTDRHVYAEIGKESHTKVGTDANMEVGGSLSVDVAGDIALSSNNLSSESANSVGIKGMNVVIEAATSLTIKVGGSFVNLNSGGVFISGPMVMINSGGAAGSVMYSSPAPASAPEKPDTADDDKPGSKTKLEKRSAARKEKTHKEGNEEKKSWIKIKFVDEAGEPVKGVKYKVTAPDGRVATGSTNKDGKAEVKNMDPGSCKITFPDLDKEAWEEG